MDLDSRKLDELLELTRDNNKILHGIRRTQRWSSVFTVVYWAVILGSIFGTYYYFQPTIEKYVGLVQSSAGTLQQLQKGVSNIPTDTQALKNLIGR
jgi:hypothetical protein